MDLLNEGAIKIARDEAEEELGKVDEDAAVRDASKPGEFDRFEELARKLVKVPKSQ